MCALLATGERGEALSLAEKDVRMTRAFGAPAPTSAALVALGLCQDDRDQAIGLLEEAVGEAQRSESRVALLAALVELGAARRRAGHRALAREPLRAAIDLADRTGATGFGDRARDELRATGARPRRERLSGPASLTASERRVAQPGRRGAHQPPDRPGAVRHDEDGRDAPLATRTSSSTSAPGAELEAALRRWPVRAPPGGRHAGAAVALHRLERGDGDVTADRARSRRGGRRG